MTFVIRNIEPWMRAKIRRMAEAEFLSQSALVRLVLAKGLRDRKRAPMRDGKRTPNKKGVAK